MKKLLATFAILVVLSLVPFSIGCRSRASTFQLFEFAGDFQTRDVNKAQMEIPFPIITPDYLPKNIKNLPAFKGTLRRYQIDVSSNLTEGLLAYSSFSGAFSNYGDNVEIQFAYTGTDTYLYITESRRPIGLGEPELNPDLKYVDILGTKAIISGGDEIPGAKTYISFQKDGLSFLLESENIPNAEVVKIAESILAKQVPDITINNPEEWPWGEAYGLYYTNNLAVAQKETKFTIITPTYVPEVFDQNSPYIEGPLASQPTNNNDAIKLLFFTAVVQESTTGTNNGKPIQNVLPVILEVTEQSMPFSAKTNIEGEINKIPIPGRNISIWIQDIGEMQYGGVTFKRGEIYIEVSFNNVDPNEIIKAVDSILS
jgi:hypothetical protein